MHGNFAKIAQWQVPVPQGWRSFSNQDTLFIQRMHRFYFRDRAFCQITVNTLPNSQAYNYQKQKELLIALAGKQGYQFNGEPKIQIEAEDVLCVSFETASNPRRLWISCDAPDLHLSIGFFGDPGYAPVLDSIAGGIKRMPPLR